MTAAGRADEFGRGAGSQLVTAAWRPTPDPDPAKGSGHEAHHHHLPHPRRGHAGTGGPSEDRSGVFEHGGWLVPFADEDLGRYVTEWIGRADAFLLGRRTYDIFSAQWPRVTDPDDPVARSLNHLPKYVVSNTLDHPAWQNTTVVGGDEDGVVKGIQALKDRPGGELQVHGSGVLAQFLMRARTHRRVPTVDLPRGPRPGTAAVRRRCPAHLLRAHRLPHLQHRGLGQQLPPGWVAWGELDGPVIPVGRRVSSGGRPVR